MSEIRIIQLSPHQWQQFRAIRLEALHEEPQAFGTTYADMAQQPPTFWQERLADSEQGEKSRLLFAQHGERLVGMIGARYKEPEDTATIIAVYVTQTFRGYGVGKALMAAILSEIAQKPGIRKADLGVNQQQVAAVALYRQFGFEVTEEKEEVQGDGKVHCGYRMAKSLK